MILYNHTQVGTVIIVSMAVAEALVYFIFRDTFALPHMGWLYWTLLLFPAAALLFGWLTVEIDNERLKWWFGPGLIRKSCRIDEIRSAEKVRNSLAWGFGIRLTPRGWLYNVSGLDAVEVTLKSGKRFRIGTDDPDGLVRAVEQAKTMVGSKTGDGG